MMASYIMDKMKNGALKNILYCATGALLSPTSVLQGESIPGICHLVNIKA
jgi:stage V sporulation protein AD